MWLSLTNVGSVVDPSDSAQLYSLANFCPPAGPVLAAFAREPKLDDVYERVINSLIGPERPYTESYFDALKIIGKVEDGVMTDETPKYRAYKLREDAYIAALTKFVSAMTPEERL